MQRRGDAGARERVSGGMRHRPMRAATQRRSVEAGLAEHVLDDDDMARLAAMRGAGERQLFVR